MDEAKKETQPKDEKAKSCCHCPCEFIRPWWVRLIVAIIIVLLVLVIGFEIGQRHNFKNFRSAFPRQNMMNCGFQNDKALPDRFDRQRIQNIKPDATNDQSGRIEDKATTEPDNLGTALPSDKNTPPDANLPATSDQTAPATP